MSSDPFNLFQWIYTTGFVLSMLTAIVWVIGLVMLFRIWRYTFLPVLIVGTIFSVTSVILGQVADWTETDAWDLYLVTVVFWTLGMLHFLIGGGMALKVIGPKVKAAKTPS